MKLEAELLRIVEEQHSKLLKSLEMLELKSKTIQEQERYIKNLGQLAERLAERLAEQEKAIQTLRDPRSLEGVLNDLKLSYSAKIEKQLTFLVSNLSIETKVEAEVEAEVEALLQQRLPILLREEIDKQLRPLTEAVMEKTASLERSQEELKPLITQMSKWF